MKRFLEGFPITLAIPLARAPLPLVRESVLAPARRPARRALFPLVRKSFLAPRSALLLLVRESVLAPRSAVVLVFSLLTPLLTTACVRRTLTITTDPPDARVYLNDQEIGHSRVTTDFLWYGDYDVAIRKDGYQTVQTNWKIETPWYQVIPLDFFFEVFWPGELHDQHERHFVLEPQQLPTQAELIERANETRELALDARK